MSLAADSFCPSCRVEIGAKHVGWCEVARCLHNGEQLLLHQVKGHPEDWHSDGDCIPDTWTGYWPGELEAALMGYWCYWDENAHPKWQVCNAAHPEARPDLNRYYAETVFHPIKQYRVPVKRVP